MTRDEAITLSIQFRAGEANRTPNQVKALHINAARRIDSYVALGMLKLDEPKSADNKLADILAAYVPGVEVEGIWREMDEAGLKIVEK